MDKKNKSTKSIEWNGSTVNYIDFLSLEGMMEFVEYVTSICFSDEGAYQPELKEFAVRSGVIEYYTDFKLPKNVSDKYKFVYTESLFATVLEAIDVENNEQFSDMLIAIDKKIKIAAQANIEMINAQMNSLNREFSSLVKQIESLFSGVSDKDISSMAKFFSNEALDKNDVLKSLVNLKEGK